MTASHGRRDGRCSSWTRPFHWGLVLIFDEAADEIPACDGIQLVHVSSSGLAILVRHAQDVDFEAMDLADDDIVPDATVTIHLTLGGPNDMPAEATFTGTIVCPSGRLVIGDADEERVVDVRPGTANIAIVLRPEEHADEVSIWIADDAANDERSSTSVRTVRDD